MIYLLSFMMLGCSGDTKTKTQPTQYPTATQASPDSFANSIEGETEPTSRIKGSLLDRHAQLGKDPTDAIALWLEAAIRAQNNEQEGWDALGYLTIPLKDATEWERSGANTYFVEAIHENNPAFRSFVVGATPENNYAVDLNNITISIAYEGERDVRGRKIMLHSSGSTMPRPIYVQESQQTHLYYIKEYSSMYVDVKAPIDPNKEQFK